MMQIAFVKANIVLGSKCENVFTVFGLYNCLCAKIPFDYDRKAFQLLSPLFNAGSRCPHDLSILSDPAGKRYYRSTLFNRIYHPQKSSVVPYASENTCRYVNIVPSFDTTFLAIASLDLAYIRCPLSGPHKWRIFVLCVHCVYDTSWLLLRLPFWYPIIIYIYIFFFSYNCWFACSTR